MRANNAVLQSIGGEELPERIGKIRDAFKAADDGTLSLTDRFKGFAGGVGLVAQTLGILQVSVSGMIGWFAQARTEFIANQQAASQLQVQYQTVAAATHNAVSAQQALSDQQAILSHGFSMQGSELATLEVAARGFASVYGGEAARSGGENVKNAGQATDGRFHYSLQ
jgi:hypothetical protein